MRIYILTVSLLCTRFGFHHDASIISIIAPTISKIQIFHQLKTTKFISCKSRPWYVMVEMLAAEFSCVHYIWSPQFNVNKLLDTHLNKVMIVYWL